MTKHAIYASRRRSVLLIRISGGFRLSSRMLKSPFEPCIPSGAKSVPDRPEWIHEIKHDGYRLIIQRDGKRVRPVQPSNIGFIACKVFMRRFRNLAHLGMRRERRR